MFADIFRLNLIVGALPVTLTNGTTADATQVMADLNWIANQVNANAAPLSGVALTNANNNFSVVQSGIAASQAANFPIASQVQNRVFSTLSSTLGTNTITARVAALPLTVYASGQVFSFVPAQPNTGPANMTIDSAGSGIIFSGGSTLVGGEMIPLIPALLRQNGTRFDLLNSAQAKLPAYQMSLGADVALNNTANYFDGPSVSQGTAGTWYVSGTVTLSDTGAGPNVFSVKLWDGTNVIASCVTETVATLAVISVSLSGVISAPTGNLRISVKDGTTTNGKILFNQSGNSKDATITALRIA